MTNNKLVLILLALYSLAGRPSAVGGQKLPDVPVKTLKVPAHFAMPAIAVPDFSHTKKFVITAFGAVAGDKEKNSAAIRKAIDAANKAGGGTVVVPAGEWLTGKVHLKSNVNLHLEKGAVLLFSEKPEDYLPAVHSTWEGIECYNYSPLIYAYQCKNVAVTGEGEVRAKMEVWKEWFARPRPHMESIKRLYNLAQDYTPVQERQMVNDTAHLRPQFIQFNRCENVLLEGITITNSPFWTIHPYLCKNVVIRKLKVYAHGHNNDGVDPEMSQNVLIEDCVFDQGDDAIAIKSGRNPEGWRLKTPSKNIVIRNLTVKNGHQLVAIGSELSGGIENVDIDHCEVVDGAKLNHLLFIKTNERMGGYVKNIYASNLTAGKIDLGVLGIETDVLYQWRTLVPTKIRKLTPISDIYLSNISVKDVKFESRILGQKELPVKNVSMQNITTGKVQEQKEIHENVLTHATRFDLVTGNAKVSIYYQKGGPKLDSIAAHLLAADIERVSGYLPKVGTNVAGAKGNVIVLGRVGSQIVNHFGKQAADAALKGEWERYSLRVLNKPLKNISQALIVAGSDVRGTAYGAFAISEKIGVTPWYWWADAAPATRKVLSLNINDFTSESPSVKFRGIFINDEDWGLQPWAAKTFEPETKDIGPKTYGKVFELLLRLKANLIWPAMHPSTKAFYHYPGNIKTAEDYQIVVGSSHAEPMLRNNVSEWNEQTMGHFNFVTNRKKVEEYWESRIKESSNFNGIYTTGMRGVHDGEIQGVKTIPETVTLLDTIIRVEREMLQKYVNKDITKVPQVFTPYKEVLEIYDAGLKVPEDITLVWPDDNYGYIQRLSNEDENKRPGGSGVYYHASYWGRPHDYLWLGTAHPAHMREEMTKAYALNARHLWVLNIGDIKPGEYAMQLFLDMAYHVKPFDKPGYSKTHLKQWLTGIFGAKNSAAISEVLWQYYNLAFERKPEYMGWSQTEPTTGVRNTAYNHNYYGDQAQQRLDSYNKLVAETAAIQSQIDKMDQPAFFELVGYPVKGAALMNRKFLYRDKALQYARQGRVSASHYARLSGQAYAEITMETGYFNEKLLNGKWRGMMDMMPRELPVFRMPEFKLAVTPNLPAFRALPEGLDTTYAASNKKRHFKLPAFDRWNKQKRFIDVFLTQNIKKSFHVRASEPWIKVSAMQGELQPNDAKSEQRIWVEIDWANARIGDLSGKISVEAGDDKYDFDIVANNADANTLPDFKGYVASDKYISINASEYTGLKNTPIRNWSVVDGLAGNGNALEAFPLTFKAVPGELDTANVHANPYVEYEFYTFGDTPANITVSTLPTYPLNKDFEMRYAVKVDDGPVKIFNFKTIGRSNEWKQNVLANSAKRTLEVPALNAGKHKLTIYMIDPGVVLQHIFIDLGTEQSFYGTLEPTADGRR